MSGVVGYFHTILLQIYHWVWYWKNCENRLTFGEVMGKSLVFSSASEVTTLWRYTNLFIIIIIF